MQLYGETMLEHVVDGTARQINVPAARLKKYVGDVQQLQQQYEARLKALIRARLTADERAAVDAMSGAEAHRHFCAAVQGATEPDIALLNTERTAADACIAEARDIQSRYDAACQARAGSRALERAAALGLLPAAPRYRRKRPPTASTLDNASLIQAESHPAPADTSAALAMAPHTRVLARWDKDGLFYPGRLGSKRGSAFVVEFASDFDEQLCKTRNIVPIDASQPALKIGSVNTRFDTFSRHADNYVLVPGTIPDCWEAHVPGTVMGVISAGPGSLFTVRTYNGCGCSECRGPVTAAQICGVGAAAGRGEDHARDARQGLPLHPRPSAAADARHSQAPRRY